MIKVISYDWGHEGLVRDSSGSLVDGWISNKANSAGGVSVKFTVRNYGTKPVKKFTVWFTPYNGAFERVKCTACNVDTRGVNCADPIGVNAQHGGLFENAWYNHSIRSVMIDRIEVTYADGTKQSCTGNYTPTPEEEASADQVDTQGCIFAGLALLIGGGLLFGLWALFVNSIFG